MAEKQASYIQASSHPADTDRLVLEGLLNPSPAPVSGAAYGVGPTAGDLLVTQKATPNMSVDVAAGHVWIDGTEAATQGAYHGYNDATKNLVVAASDPTNPRKDLVVAKVQDAAYSGATNAWSLAVVTGTPAASPAEPTVPANAVVLAMVNVAALATTITNANITDRRRRACGLSGIAVCSSTSRPAAPYIGMTIFETDTTKLLLWTGTLWQELTSVYSSGAGSAWTAGTAYSDTGPSITVPAGKWCVQAKGNFDHSTATVQSYSARLYNSTDAVELDAISVNGGATNAREGFSLFGTLNIAASKVVKLQALTSAVSGAQLLGNLKLWATPVTALL